MTDILDGKLYKEFLNILSEEEISTIENTLSSPIFPWYFSRTKYTAHKDDIDKFSHNPNVIECLQMVHVFYNNDSGITRPNSDFCNLIITPFQKMLDVLDIPEAELFRCKSNLQTQHQKSNKDSYNTPHIDLPDPHYVMLYYANDADGDTFLFDENYQIVDRISSQRGKIVIFNGLTLHAGSNPVSSDYRIVVNYNFKV